MIKKILSFLLIALLISPIAMAYEFESPTYYFEGKVNFGQQHPIIAPMSGTVSNLYTKNGLAVNEGEKILEISPDVATSPIEGVVGSIIAKEGDNLDTLKELYKAVMYIDSSNKGIANCSHVHSAKPYEYKNAILGETVYLQNRNDKTQTGVGEVISRDKSRYVVRMTEGNIKFDSKIYVYRSPDFDNNRRLGGGTLKRQDPVAVNTPGYMVQILVKPGDKVKSGDPLYKYTNKISSENFDTTIKMPASGIITKIEKKVTDKIEAGEVVGSYILNDEKYITANVAEMDANRLKVGDKIIGTALSAGRNNIECEIISISAIPDDKGFYEVQLNAKGVADLRVGTTISFSSVNASDYTFVDEQSKEPSLSYAFESPSATSPKETPKVDEKGKDVSDKANKKEDTDKKIEKEDPTSTDDNKDKTNKK